MARKDQEVAPTQPNPPPSALDGVRAPSRAGVRADAPPAPSLAMAPPFDLAWHPLRWVVRSGRIVPDLARVHHSPNVNGCRIVVEQGEIKADTDKLESIWRRDGYTLIPHSLAPNGISYSRRVGPSADGLGMWVDIWTTTYPGSSVVTVDVAARDEWACSLVGKVISPPPAYVLEALLSEQQAATQALEMAALSSPTARNRIRQHEAAIAVLEAALSPTPAAPAA